MKIRKWIGTKTAGKNVSSAKQNLIDHKKRALMLQKDVADRIWKEMNNDLIVNSDFMLF